jgi:hypothetical protein
MTGAAADLLSARFGAGVVAARTSHHAPARIELKDIAQSGSGRERGIDGEEA